MIDYLGIYEEFQTLYILKLDFNENE